jgi:hypothetical protein
MSRPQLPAVGMQSLDESYILSDTGYYSIQLVERFFGRLAHGYPCRPGTVRTTTLHSTRMFLRGHGGKFAGCHLSLC